MAVVIVMKRRCHRRRARGTGCNAANRRRQRQGDDLHRAVKAFNQNVRHPRPRQGAGQRCRRIVRKGKRRQRIRARREANRARDKIRVPGVVPSARFWSSRPSVSAAPDRSGPAPSVMATVCVSSEMSPSASVTRTVNVTDGLRSLSRFCGCTNPCAIRSNRQRANRYNPVQYRYRRTNRVVRPTDNNNRRMARLIGSNGLRPRAPDRARTFHNRHRTRHRERRHVIRHIDRHHAGGAVAVRIRGNHPDRAKRLPKSSAVGKGRDGCRNCR